jgi:alkyl hydroperoxide reductase subunit AhpC
MRLAEGVSRGWQKEFRTTFHGCPTVTFTLVQVVGASVDSHFTHLAWINTPRKQGGLGPMNIPLLADLTHKIGKDYGCYVEEDGHTAR